MSNFINRKNKLSEKVNSFSAAERIFILLLVCLAIFFIISLAADFSGFTITQDESENRTEIFISPEFELYFGRELSEKLLQNFHELHPDIKISFFTEPDETNDEPNGDNDDYIKSEPDIFIFSEANYNSFLDGRKLSLIDGQRAVTLVSFMDLLFYNIDLLIAAGFDRPPKTRDEFIVYTRTVTNGNNAALINALGFVFALNPEDGQAVSRDILSWFWASGSDFWADKIIPRGDITFLGNLARESVIGFHLTGDQVLEEFASGRIALMINSTRVIPFLRERMGDDAFGITTIPDSGLGGKYNIVISNIYAGINTASENYDTALLFVRFLAENRELLFTELNAVPGDASDLFFGEYLRDDPFYSKANEIFEFSQIVEGFSGKPNGSIYENIVREEFQVFFESLSAERARTAQQTAAAIQQRWNDLAGE